MTPEDGAITRGLANLTGFGLVMCRSVDFSIEQSRRFVVSGDGQDRPAVFEVAFQEKRSSRGPKHQVFDKAMRQGLP